jgi:hypothetical protein
LLAGNPRRTQEIDTMTISPKAQPPVPQTLLGSCPGCNAEIAARLQLAFESIRFAAKRPATPELLILCRQCRRQFVVMLLPMPEAER